MLRHRGILFVSPIFDRYLADFLEIYFNFEFISHMLVQVKTTI